MIRDPTMVAYSENQATRASSIPKKNLYLVVLVAVLVMSAGINLYGNDFPLGYHSDEVIKIHFIQDGTQDFRHPILILQIVRAANRLFQFENPQQIVVLGRSIMALLGTGVVLLTYTLSRQMLGKQYALGAALLTAVSPGIVMHSHYLKEDIAFTFGILLSFLCYFHFADQILTGVSTRTMTKSGALPLWISIWLLGISTGLMVSAKYKSVIIVCLFVITPLYVYRLRNRDYYKGLMLAFVIALPTFLVINLPILFHVKTFVTGFTYELKHAATGHAGITIYPLEQLFTFHIRKSILPSFAPVPLLLAGFYIAYCLIRWRTIDWRDRFLVTYVLVFYSILEISPLKPFPGFVRYIIPLLPVLSYQCMQAIQLMTKASPPQTRQPLFLALITIIISLPLVDSLKLDYSLNRDTRDQIDAILATKQKPIIAEAYVEPFAYPLQFPRLADIDLEGEDRGTCTLVASSFMYDRYLFGGTLRHQNPEVYKKRDQYLALFQHPYTEIAPAHRSFAFSNPTLRVIDLCQKE